MKDVVDEFTPLPDPQRAALRHVREVAAARQPTARATVTAIVQRAGCTMAMLDAALECWRLHARVVLHFHPDRYGVKPMTVAEALLQEGQYRSQFETGLSSGGLTAFSGGARDTWERTLFGGAYHSADWTTAERPKYGALEVIRHADGPWPRFGSCYFVLRPTVSWRTSFTFLGSELPLAPERFGTIDRLEPVLAPLLTEIAGGARAAVPSPPFVVPTLGVEGLTVPRLLAYACRELPPPRAPASMLRTGRILDSGIEAQVHGPIALRRDIERLVVDPSFEHTPTGECLKELSRRYEIPLDWHSGFRLAVPDVPDDFRGPAMPRLARRIAPDRVLDVATIGAAAASLRFEPGAWRNWGSHEETLQQLKQLWHVLVHYGSPMVREG